MRVKHILKPVFLIFSVYCLIFYSWQIKPAVLSAMKLWAQVIIPSVFPYLIISEYIASAKLPELFYRMPLRIINRIFAISPCSVKVLLCGMICGYPSGAICAQNLYRQSYITKKEAVHLIGFTNNAGPLFLISAVGGSMLGDTAKGFALYIIQLLSALIYGIVTAKHDTTPSDKAKWTLSSETDFCDAVRKSVVTTVNICGFMIASYTLSAIVMTAVNFYLPCNGIYKVYAECLCAAFFEISAGMQHLCRLSLSPAGFGFICASVSWSGLSVIMQIKSVSKDLISLKDIIIPKLWQSAISFILGYIYMTTCREYTYNPVYVLNETIPIIICTIIFILYIIRKRFVCR